MNQKKKRICALITDFGTRDPYVGTLKGVIKKINPFAEVIDITNDIPSFCLLSAAFVIDKTYPFFPESTIFLVVVDPGVGSDRKILLLEYGDYFFIAPDNGVLTPILQKEEKNVAVINNTSYFIMDENSTFEARDKMAPVAAYLSTGVDPGEIAVPYGEFIFIREYFPSKSEAEIKAKIVYIDKFGNIITNVTENYLFKALKESGLTRFKARFNTTEIDEFFDIYAKGKSDPFIIIGSHQNIEVAMNQKSAASFFNAKIGDPIFISMFN